MRNKLITYNIIKIFKKFNKPTRKGMDKIVKYIDLLYSNKIKTVSFSDNRNVLMYICYHINFFNFSFFKELLDKLISIPNMIEYKDNSGKNVFFYILDKKITNPDISNHIIYTVTKLLKRGLNINEIDDSGKNPLFYFLDKPHSDNSYYKILELLIDNCINTCQQDIEGNTCLMRIIYKNYSHLYGTFKKIIENTFYNINLINDKGESLILLSCLKSENESLKRMSLDLIRLGCRVDFRNPDGDTVLLSMLKQIPFGGSKDFEIFKALCSSSFLNDRNNKGETALIIVAKNTYHGDFYNYIDMLLEYGADPTLRDKNGKTYDSYIDKSKKTACVFHLDINPSILKNTEELTVECIICFNEITRICSLIPCGHSNLCEVCYGKVLNCPVCRGEIISSRILTFKIRN